MSRAEGRSATAAAAYRSGQRIACEREGRVHDYRARSGVERSFIVAPADAPAWAQDRTKLWNAVEAAEKRKDAKVAREWEVALPHELGAREREELARGFAAELVSRYGVAADVSIHAPGKDGDRRNHHAHILVTTRRMGADGLGAKTRELDVKQTSAREIAETRELWATMVNRSLERQGIAERVDHRSLAEQRRAAEARGDMGAVAVLNRPAERHMGPTVAAMERRVQRAAEARREPYEPVTERGLEVHTAREARGLAERLRELRQAYGEARQQGAGRLAALRAGMARSGSSQAERGEDRADGAGTLMAGLRDRLGFSRGNPRNEEEERRMKGDRPNPPPADRAEQWARGSEQWSLGGKLPTVAQHKRAETRETEKREDEARKEREAVARTNATAKKKEERNQGAQAGPQLAAARDSNDTTRQAEAKSALDRMREARDRPQQERDRNQDRDR